MGLLAMSISSQGTEPDIPKGASAAIVSLDAELAAIVQDTARPLASLSVLAVRDGKVVYHKQFGRRFIDEKTPANSKPANSSTQYRIASISKLVTTLGVLRLVEDGKLALDRDVSDYLGYRLRNPYFPDDPITLRMLLTHTSSLRDEGGYYWEAKHALKDALLPAGSLYGTGAMWAQNAKPGAYFQYANLPWGVIGTIMERASGERFDRLMKRLVLDPLGLRGGFNPAEFSKADLDNTAALYRKAIEVNDKHVWNPAGPWVPQVDDYRKVSPVPRAGPDYVIGTNGTAFGPQGNIRLSAADLGKIMLMLMNNGVHAGKPFLKSQTIETMLSVQWRHDAVANNGSSSYGTHKDQFNAWGLGNQQFLDLSGKGSGDRLVDGGGFKAVGHLGDAWGLTSALVFDRIKRNGMIYLIGGPGFDPDTNPGKYSAMYRHEEKILNAIYQRVIAGAVY
ncbi:MAG: serine hydrolase [Betaproteobacteria bacterium]|nr:serine hydrolase [Betaproteobacteria bacterium]